MDLFLKHKDHLNGDYFVTSKDFSAICPYTPGPRVNGLCWEYDVIEKINRNEEGYFDFSKNLIDIGCEDGGYAIFCNFNKNYCFEPNKQMCSLIWTNMYLKDKIDNTEVYNVFLGEKEDEILFNGFSCEGSVNYDSRGRLSEPIKMKQHLLDEYNIQNVGLIKTDTEGFDYFVLKGGIRTIINSNYPPILFENWAAGFREGSNVEWTKEQHDRINDFLTGLGYKIYERWGDHETHLALNEKYFAKKEKVIVSMTTIPSRREKLIDVNLKSLLNQSYNFDKLEINIDDNLTDEDYEFYESLKDLDSRIEINICESKWRSCNKLLPTLIKYPNDIIITVDDDLNYPKDTILKLIEKYKDNQDCIITHATSPIIMRDGKFKCVKNDSFDVRLEQKSFSKYLSCACLFPPRTFDGTDIFNYDKMYELTEGTHDELWFWVNSTLKGVKSICLNDIYEISGYHRIPDCSDDGYCLANINWEKWDWFDNKIIELYGDKLNDVITREKTVFKLNNENVFSFIAQIDLFNTLYTENYKIDISELDESYVIYVLNDKIKKFEN